jgi:hypothetical protein
VDGNSILVKKRPSAGGKEQSQRQQQLQCYTVGFLTRTVLLK